MGNVLYREEASAKLINDLPTKTCLGLFLDETFADFHFVIDAHDEKIRVPSHKILLAKCSPFFEALFYGSFGSVDEMSIRYTSVDELKEFLQFFYVREPQLTFKNIPKVMELLDKYLLKQCMEICELFLFQFLSKCSLEDEATRINVLSDICFVHQLAFTYQLKRLEEICLVAFYERQVEMITTDSFRHSSQDFLRYILDIDSLSYRPKLMLDACIEWAKVRCESSGLDATQVENLREQLGDCLHYIQYGLMTHMQFSQYIAQHSGLFDGEELEEIALIMANSSTELKKFKRKPIQEWTDDDAIGSNTVTSNTGRVNQVEILSFRTNQTLLLGAIGLPKISRNDEPCPMKGAMAITSRISDDSLNETNILLEQSIEILPYEGQTQMIKLSEPIICHSDVLYEIQIVFGASHWEDELFAICSTKTSAFFHGHCIQVFVERESIICDLYFNLLFKPVSFRSRSIR